MEVLGCLLQCGKMAKTRGLCIKHYQLTLLAVQRGETTWEQEAAQGRATNHEDHRRGWRRWKKGNQAWSS